MWKVARIAAKPWKFPPAGVVALLLFAAAGGGCKSPYASMNKPLDPQHLAPDCRASFDITQPRGEKDVLVLLCLSGGGSRAAWFSAATMLRLEQVEDKINLLHEVDVISSVSGSGLTSAYYCASRDPGPYSVVRVEQLPESLPAELASSVKMDRERGLLGVSGKMSEPHRDLLLTLFDSPHDKECVLRLHWLSHNTRAPEVWQPARTREVLTRNYTGMIAEASFSPLNLWDDWLYWTTDYNRSDQMAKIFTHNLFGTKVVQIPAPVQAIANLEFLDRPDRSGSSETDRLLRWPQVPAVHSPVGRFGAGLDKLTTPFVPFVPYRFKDLNPERPYLILNAANGTEDDPNGLRFGDIFTFTREDFATHLNSSIDDYDVAHGVMASAAFPGAFSFVNLRDYRPAQPGAAPQYLHVFDGGTVDNLGLTSAKKIILANRDRYRHFVVILVDSHVNATGASRNKADVRDRIIDLNFLHTFDMLLDSVRKREIDEFKSNVLDGKDLAGKMTFWHITFDDVRDAQLRAKANRIATLFNIDPPDVEVVQRCAEDLVRPDHPKLQEFLRVLRVHRPPAAD